MKVLKTGDVVKSLVTECDVKEGKFYEVTQVFSNKDIYVKDDVEEEHCLYLGEFQSVYNSEKSVINELINQVEQWSKDKGLDLAEPTKQFLKVSEEFGEIGAALARGNEDMFKDAVGDTVVTLIILAQQKGYTLEECLQVAYDEIKGRKGQMVDGVFVKDSDLKEPDHE